MYFHILLWLELMFQGNIFGSGTHTHKIPLLIRCLWLTQPPEHKTSQHAALPQPLWMVPQHQAVFCSCYTDPFFWNRMRVSPCLTQSICSDSSVVGRRQSNSAEVWFIYWHAHSCHTWSLIMKIFEFILTYIKYICTYSVYVWGNGVL
jgi:hypothetical protein